MKTKPEEVMHAFEIIEEEGNLSIRERHLMEVARHFRDHAVSLEMRLAETLHAVREARTKCRRDREILCELYSVDAEIHHEEEFDE
jgi:hypothetical protein